MHLAEHVLQRARLVLDRCRDRPERAPEHLERVAQALGGDAQVVQLADVRRIAHGLVELEHVGDPLGGDAACRPAQLRSRAEPLDAAGLHVAETSASAACSSRVGERRDGGCQVGLRLGALAREQLEHVRHAGLLARARRLEEAPHERDLHVEIARAAERLGVAAQHAPRAPPRLLVEPVGEHVERAREAAHGHAHVVQRLGVARADRSGRDAGEVRRRARRRRAARLMRRGSPGSSSTLLARAIRTCDRGARRPFRARPPRGCRPCRTTAARPGARRRHAGSSAPAGMMRTRSCSSSKRRAMRREGCSQRMRTARSSASMSSSGPTRRRRLEADPATAEACCGCGISPIARQRLVDDPAHALELERPRRVVLDAEVGQAAGAELVGVREVDAVADRADHDLGRAATDVDHSDLALPGLVERVERADPGQARLLVLVDDLELVAGVGEHARGQLLPVLGLARRGGRDDAQVGRAELARDARRSCRRASLTCSRLWSLMRPSCARSRPSRTSSLSVCTGTRRPSTCSATSRRTVFVPTSMTA